MSQTSELIFRVIFESRENYRVMDQWQRTFPAEVAGKVRRPGALWPAVGDWVYGTPQPGDWIQITEVLQRKSQLARKDPGGIGEQVLAANVDTLFVVTSANQDLNLNRLDRYVSLALAGNILPVIVVNKIELAEEPDALLESVALRFSGISILGVSVFEGHNLQGLDTYMSPEQTVAFVGSSGVGKTSLSNCLLGGAKLHTQEIRDDDGKGRHTTTHRELHLTPTGAAIIDTPGIRQVGLIDDTHLESAFPEIEELSMKCRFGDCRHETEPGCAIKVALEDGTLEISRWESFQKLKRELAFEARKVDKALQSEEKRRWAKIHKANRAAMKLRGR